MSIYTERLYVRLNDRTMQGIARLSATAGAPPATYVRGLLERHVQGDPLTSLHIVATLDKVWIAVDALLKTQTWDPALRATVREIIERRAGRIDA